MTKRLSPAALAHTDELLAKMHGVGSVSSTFLEEWWGTKRRVQRVELFRLLNDLADDGRIAKLSGRRWCLPVNAPKAAVPAEAPVTPPAAPAPVVHGITLIVGGVAVTVASPDKAAAQAVALAYQRARVRQTAPLRPLAIGKAPLPTPPPPPPANAPARGTVAWRIWSLLKKRPRTVAELVAALNTPAPSARGRLSEMSAAGLVARRVDGVWEAVSLWAPCSSGRCWSPSSAASSAPSCTGHGTSSWRRGSNGARCRSARPSSSAHSSPPWSFA